MMNMSDLPETIPLFVLPGAVLLPRARLPLHVFEPRYLQMFEDALKTPHRFIGMIQPQNMPEEDSDDDEPLHLVGCAGRVTQFSETDNGRYMITLSGISRFKIVQEVTGFSPYRKAQVDWADFDRDMGAVETDEGFEREAFLAALNKFFEAQDLQTDWDSLKDAEPEMLINSLSMLCPFELEEKQALLEAPTLSARREALEVLMEFSLRGGFDEEVLQ